MGDQGHRSNNFDALRLGAAFAVLVSHSFVLTGRREPAIGTLSLGAVGVYMFFAISGYLITRSWSRQPDLGPYLVKRILRIMPALVAVVVLVTIFAGFFLTTLSPAAYFGQSAPWHYIASNIFVLGKATYYLPGVFVHDPYPIAVNGSLWTLSVEFKAYLWLAVVGVIALRSRRWSGVAGMLLLILSLASGLHLTGIFGNDTYFRVFGVGACLYLWRDRIPRSPQLALLLLAICVVFSNTVAQALVATVALSYVTIVAAHGRPVLRWATSHGDLSYGIYLWAFPVQQTITSVLPHVTPWEMIAIAAPVTVALAAVSWKLIERPALTLKMTVVGVATPPGPVAVNVPASD